MEKYDTCLEKEYIPVDIRSAYQLAEHNFAVQRIHFPQSQELLRQAETRAAARGEEIRRDAQAEGEALRQEAESRLDAAADLIVGRVVKD